MPVVYLHRKPVDGSIFYVGIGNKEKRAYHFYGRNAHWTNTYNKYGAYVEIVANVATRELANELEEFLIEEIGIDNLCNKTLGGDGFKGEHSKESRAKMSKSQTGLWKGKKRSEYFCKRAKESKIGYRPTDEAIANGVKARKEKAALIKELTTGFIGKIWDIEKRFSIDRRAVYANCKHNNPITKFKFEGLNFVKHSELTTL
jgi:hypothetical protein